jgi:hypothetical protein
VNFNQLNEFIANKMILQVVYQPVMIKTLLESGNIASVQHIAQSIWQLDESQLITIKQLRGSVM